MNIRPMSDADGEAVMQIYQQGCDTGHATFAEHAGEWTTWDSDHLPECRLVAEINGAVLGWVALSALSSRWVYRGVAEVSLYVDENGRGEGIGGALRWRR